MKLNDKYFTVGLVVILYRRFDGSLTAGKGDPPLLGLMWGVGDKRDVIEVEGKKKGYSSITIIRMEKWREEKSKIDWKMMEKLMLVFSFT